ncbi:MAG: alpha/beta fold hydrolase [Thermomicrobiales bacterium]
MPQVKVNGLSVTYDSAGSGPPVLMINGIGADRSGWGMQIPAVSQNFRAITYDNRDVGETAWIGEPHDYAIAQFAADAAALLDALDIDRAHIVGASMGGAIAQEFAIHFPERTKSVTIVCSWPRSDPWMVELMTQWDHIFRHQGQVAWNRNSWLWVFTYRYYAEPGNLKALVQLAEQAPNPQTFEQYLRQSAAFKRHDALDRLPGISSPAHVICGEEDIYTPLRYSMEMANAIPGATLSVIPEVGHGMFWEATDAFNALIVDFLNDVEAGNRVTE